MKIIKSNCSSGAYLGVLQQLKNNLDGSSKNVVIAPDRFTASVERGLISSLGIESTFGIEVMSFTRLAGKLIGDEIKKCLTPEGSVMLIGKVIADKRDELLYYGKVAMTEGFASELYAALTAVRNSGVTSKQLVDAANGAKASLKAKAHDIALIYDGYLAALEGKHSDSSTRLFALAEYIRNHPEKVATTNFYCTDIYEFSAPELDIVKGLADNALSLTIGLVSGYDNPNKRIYPDRVIKRLASLCRDKAEIVDNKQELSAQQQAISTKLFAYIGTDGNDKTQNDGKVTLRSAKSRYDEVTKVAIDVAKHVREGGRYRDIEVYLSDVDAYEWEIKNAFERYNIPYFIDKKELLSHQTRAKFALQAIACVRSNFRLRETLDFVKNPLFYSGLENGESLVYLFENYCLKYNVEYMPKSREFDRKQTDKKSGISPKSKFIHANAADKDAIVDNTNENEPAEVVRKAVFATLSPLTELGVKPIKEYVGAMRKLLEESNQRYLEYVERLATLSEYYRKVAEQVDSKINSVLDEIEEVLDYDTDVQGFESVFKSMLKTLKIALVPTFLDCVFVGGSDSRFMGDGDVYILGANNSKFPKSSGGGAVITPKDEETLHALGVEITPNEMQKIMTDMYAACDLMKKPKGRLVVSYSETGDGGAMRPSTVVFELQNMLEQDGKPLAIERIDIENFYSLDGQDKYDAIKAADVFATKRACFNEVMRNVTSGRADARNLDVYASAYEFVQDCDKQRVDDAVKVPERIEKQEGAYFGETTSVSRLETFFGCPYAHYFNYVLSLRRRKDGKFEGTENGTILHYVLERFFKDVRDGKIDDSTDFDKKADEYFYAAVKENEFDVLLEKPDTGRLLMRVKAEGARLIKDLYKVQKRSKFRPCFLEAKIGEGKILPVSLDIGERKIGLKGTIDRVDVLDDKFIVIDYKTYKSADLSLKELYAGQKIQLYVYMRAVEKSIGAKPCGVFYFPIFSSFTDDVSDRYKYKGQAGNSREMLCQIDDMVKTDPEKSVLPYKVDKQGNFNESVHLSTKAFDTLGDYAIEIATQGAKEIANGFIRPTPLYGKCDKCDFAAICAYKGMNERKLPKVSDTSVFELDKESDEQNAKEKGGDTTTDNVKADKGEEGERI